MKLEDYIYANLMRYDYRVGFAPREDVMQEIAYAICIVGNGNVFREASRQVYRLLSDYGYSRKKGKDNFDAEHLLIEQKPPIENEADRLDELRRLYLEEGKTAKEVCEYFNVPFTQRIVRLLSAIFPKGGSRTGHNGKKIPYTQEYAENIASKHGLSPITVGVWRHRGHIPGKYVEL